MGKVKARDIVSGWPRGRSTVPPLHDYHRPPGFEGLLLPSDWSTEWRLEEFAEETHRQKVGLMMWHYWNSKMSEAAGPVFKHLRTGWHTESQINFMLMCAELEKRYHDAVDRILS